MRRFVQVIFASALALAACFSPVLATQVCTRHTYLGNDPDEGNPGWHEEAQGLAHDASNWYVTQNPNGSPTLWRIPVDYDLADGVSCGGDISCIRLADTELAALGYDHFGDPDVFSFQGHHYVLVPIENGAPGPGIALFRADETLEYVTYVTLPGQTHSGWIAVEAFGVLISSDADPVTVFFRYRPDWAGFIASGETALALTPLTPMPLLDEWSEPLTLRGAQGGEMGAGYFYFSNGFGSLPQATWGVHVFRIRDGKGSECAPVGGGDCVVARKLERSVNAPGGFAYEFDFDNNGEEPEGLTYWEGLDAQGAPGLGGQLHVILLDNDALSEDDVYVKHYERGTADDDPPVVACPSNTTVECAGPAGVSHLDARLAPFFAGFSAKDACADDLFLHDDAPASLPLGSTTVQFTAQDNLANQAGCTASVSVVDTIAPQIQCPANLDVGTDSGRCSATLNPGQPTVIEACSATVGSVRSDGAALSSSFPRGTTTITWTASDRAAHSASCPQSVVVRDLEGPRVVLTEPNHDVTANPPLSIPVNVRATVSENCSVVARETIRLQGCLIYDGAIAGDRDGLLSDERIQLTKVNLCQFMAQCGFTTLQNPLLRYEAVDPAGNLGFDQHILRKLLLKTEACAR